MKSNIITPVAIAVGITALADMSKGSVRLKVFLGGAIYGLMIAGAAEINEEVAVAFAWVVAITALLTSGQVVFTAIGKGLK